MKERGVILDSTDFFHDITKLFFRVFSRETQLEDFAKTRDCLFLTKKDLEIYFTNKLLNQI